MFRATPTRAFAALGAAALAATALIALGGAQADAAVTPAAALSSNWYAAAVAAEVPQVWPSLVPP